MDWNLIHSYLAGECTGEERKRFEQWLDEDEQHRQFYTSIKKIWDASAKKPIGAAELQGWIKSDDEAWKELKAEKARRVKFHSNRPDKQLDHHTKYTALRSRKKGVQKQWMYSVAAVLAIIALLFVFRPENHISKPQIVRYEMASGPDEHIYFKLSDGTAITLNENSKVIVYDTFNAQNRKVYLEGEAFFEVTHDEQHPFIVDLGNAIVKDLGTKFNIRSRNTSEKIQVAVLEGKVSLKNIEVEKQSDIILTKGYVGVYNEAAGRFIKEKTYAANYISWMTGKLIFKNRSLLAISENLERIYDIQIEFANNKLKERNVSLIIEKKDLKTILNIISSTLNIDHRREANTIVWQKLITEIRQQTNTTTTNSN